MNGKRPVPGALLAGVSKGGTIVCLFLLIALFSVLTPGSFATTGNIATVLSQAAVLAMMAGGITLVLVMGDFDLSIGFIATLTGVVVVKLLAHGMEEWLAVLLAVLCGAGCGVINGIIVAYGRIGSFIATLGTGAIFEGVVLWLTQNGVAQTLPLSGSSFENIGQAKWFGVLVPVYIAAVTLLLLWFVLNKTESGRRMDATGGNITVARLAGIRTARYRVAGFVISGLCSGAAGVVLAAELGAGYSDSGTTFLLEAFTACFIGAVTLRDNEFHIVGTVVGVLILSVTFVGLTDLSVASYWQNIAQGAILIVAVGSTVAVTQLRSAVTARGFRSRAQAGAEPDRDAPSAEEVAGA
jgi:ribose transport system permease protein